MHWLYGYHFGGSIDFDPSLGHDRTFSVGRHPTWWRNDIASAPCIWAVSPDLNTEGSSFELRSGLSQFFFFRPLIRSRHEYHWAYQSCFSTDDNTSGGQAWLHCPCCVRLISTWCKSEDVSDVGPCIRPKRLRLRSSHSHRRDLVGKRTEPVIILILCLEPFCRGCAKLEA